MLEKEVKIMDVSVLEEIEITLYDFLEVVIQKNVLPCLLGMAYLVNVRKHDKNI